jgi:hypothetical protein
MIFPVNDIPFLKGIACKAANNGIDEIITINAVIFNA